MFTYFIPWNESIYVQLSDHLPLIDSATLRHGVGKCVCMCFINDLKLNHGRIWLYIAHKIFSLLIYSKKNYATKLPKPKSYLSL